MKLLKQAVQAVKVSWKEESLSALHTFVAAFLIEIGAHLSELSLESVSKGVLVAVLFAAVRSGVKALLLSLAAKIKK